MTLAWYSQRHELEDAERRVPIEESLFRKVEARAEKLYQKNRARDPLSKRT